MRLVFPACTRHQHLGPPSLLSKQRPLNCWMSRTGLNVLDKCMKFEVQMGQKLINQPLYPWQKILLKSSSRAQVWTVQVFCALASSMTQTGSRWQRPRPSCDYEEHGASLFLRRCQFKADGHILSSRRRDVWRAGDNRAAPIHYNNLGLYYKLKQSHEYL